MFLLTYYLLKLLFILIDCFYLHFWNDSRSFSLDFFFLFPNFFIQFPIFLFVFAVVQLISHTWFFVTPWIANTRLPSPSQSPGLGSNSYHWLNDAYYIYFYTILSVLLFLSYVFSLLHYWVPYLSSGSIFLWSQ